MCFAFTWATREYLNLSAGFAGDARGMGMHSALLHYEAILHACAVHLYAADPQIGQRVCTRIFPPQSFHVV